MLPYQRIGNEESPNKVLFLHGTGLGGWMWQKTLPYFGDMDCYIFDLPGHADASEIVWHSADHTASKITNSIGSFDPDCNYHIVGHSMGATVGLSLLAAHPENFSSASLNTMMMGAEKDAQAFVSWIIGIAKPFMNMGWVQNMALKALGVPKSDYNRVRALMNDVDTDIVTTAFLDTLFSRYPARLYGVLTRSLILTIKREDENAMEYTQKLETFLPNAKHIILEDKKDFWFWNEADLFARTIRACIENTGLPADLRE